MAVRLTFPPKEHIIRTRGAAYWIDYGRQYPARGDKERARHAGKPDGAMHSPGPIRAANAAAKPKRAPRRKAVAS